MPRETRCDAVAPVFRTDRVGKSFAPILDSRGRSSPRQKAPSSAAISSSRRRLCSVWRSMPGRSATGWCPSASRHGAPCRSPSGTGRSAPAGGAVLTGLRFFGERVAPVFAQRWLRRRRRERRPRSASESPGDGIRSRSTPLMRQASTSRASMNWSRSRCRARPISSSGTSSAQ